MTTRPELVTLSATTGATLRALARTWGVFLERDRDSSLSDLARSSALGQQHLACRLAVVARTREELAKALEAHAADVVPARRPPRIAFVFSGGGPQAPQIGRRLLDEPVFAASMAECDALVQRDVGFSVLEEIQLEGDRSRLGQLGIFVPSIFSVQVSLARLWRSWGVVPSVVLGHSMGEIAAAHVAGSLSLSDAVRATTSRSRVMSTSPSTGGMAVVGLSYADAERAIAGRENVFVSATNGPRLTALSGTIETLEALIEELTERGVFCRFLKGVLQAHHSPLVEPLLGPYGEAVAGVAPRPGTIPIYSTLESRLTDGAHFDGRYWTRNMRHPVRFTEAIDALADRGVDRFVELSPHPALLAAVDDALADRGYMEGRQTVASLRRDAEERETLLSALGALYTAGAAIDWRGVFGVPSGHESGYEPRVPIVEPLPPPPAVVAAGDPAPAENGAQESLSAVHEALIAIEEMQAELEAERSRAKEPIAIVSMACRYPLGANTPEKLWSLLEDGVDCIRDIPKERFDTDALFDPAGGRGKIATRSCGMLDLEEVQGFDPLFFGISPREAMAMDPQQRLLVETAYEAFERAGIAPDRLSGSRTGVFVGICSQDYYFETTKDAESVTNYTMTGNVHSFAAGRISYLLDLAGPSYIVDTACSASLVAAHLASRSLRSGECDMAVVSGVNLVLSPSSLVFYTQMNVLAADGRAKSFDASADGANRGEGCGAVLLKRLSDAQADGDIIHAVIRGSACNQDGRSNGITAPNLHAQEAVIREALSDSGLSPGDVGCIEAHGTGTKLGDPIEIGALKAVYGTPCSDGAPCAVTSIKSNIGHTEAAAGISGILKGVLSLANKAIPQVVHFRELNPHIDLRGSRVTIPNELQIWPRTGPRPRRLGVSSFGATGTNVHLILEEAPAREEPAEARLAAALEVEATHRVFAVSGRTPTSLANRIAALCEVLEKRPELTLDDVCFTLNAGRAHHAHRVAVVASSAVEAVRAFREAKPGTPPASSPRVALSFTAFTGASLTAGRALYRVEPVVRETVDKFDALFQERGSLSLARFLSEKPPNNEPAGAALGALELSLAVGLAALFRSFGVEPAIVHAKGGGSAEVAALHAAGAIDDVEAVDLVLAPARARGARGREIIPLVLEEPLPDVDVVLVIGAQQGEAVPHVLSVVAGLYQRGVAIDFRGVHAARPGRRVLLPTYPFERTRQWAPILDAPADHRGGASTMLPGLRGRPIEIAGLTKKVFERTLAAERPSYLAHHRLFGVPLLAGAAHVELMLAASAELGRGGVTIEKLEFVDALTFPDGGGRTVQVHVETAEGRAQKVEVFASSGEGAPWTKHASARITPGRGPTRGANGARESLTDIRARVGDQHRVDVEGWYAKLRNVSVELGPEFQSLVALAARGAEAVGEIALPPALSNDAYVFHPVLLDGCLQTAGPLLASVDGASPYIPVSIDSIHVERPIPTRVFCHARVRPAGASPEHRTIDLRIFDATGTEAGVELAVVEGLTVRRLSSRTTLGLDASGLLDWLYQVSWKPVPPLPSVAAKQRAPREGFWLMFADRDGIAETIATRLRAPCYVARAGESEPGDYRRLIQEVVAEAGEKCLGVLHFWSLDAGSEELGPRSILEVLRELGPDRPVPLTMITRGAQVVDERDRERDREVETTEGFGGAMLWGMARSLAAERPGLVRTIDLDPSAAHGDAELDALVAEIEHGAQDRETELAFRRGERWACRLMRAPRSAVSPAAYRWDPDGTYLVLGGLGGLGRALARHVVARGARHVVLAGRSRPSAAIEAEIAELRAERDLDLRVAWVDLASRDSIRQLLREIGDARHPLRGVVHSAAALRDGIVTNQTWETFTEVLSPKVEGTRNLQLVLEEVGLSKELDFVVYFASGASTIGSAGQANYAAANAFQDRMARRLASRGQRVVSLNWGPWIDLGGVEWASALETSERRGFRLIEPESGFAILDHALAAAPPQLLVLPVDWARLARSWPDGAAKPLFAELIAAETGTAGAGGTTRGRGSFLEALRAAPAGERQAMLVEHVRSVIGRVLCIPEASIDPTAPLSPLGLDSLVALQIKHRIELDLAVALPVVELLRGASIGELCAVLEHRIALASGSVSGAKPEQTAPRPSAPRPAEIDAEEASTLLERIGDLSDEEVTRQLGRLLDT